jgi:hypothetical protein
MCIEARLDILKKDLLHPAGPSISTNRNYPFAIFHYPPGEEFKMRTKLLELLELLRSKGWTILNVDLFSTLLGYLSELEEGELIDALVQEEKLQYSVNKKDFTISLNVLQNALDGIFKDKNQYPQRVLQKIKSVSTGCDEKHTVVFLSRIGGLYPFYRTSSLLRFLDDGITVPTIVLYPGDRTEQYYLSFMGEMDADRDYRPRIY